MTMTKYAKKIGLFLFILFGLFALWVMYATAQTSMGPVKTPQLNQTLYVGQTGYATIQSAVSYACRTGNKSFAVVIQPGITPSDQIANVTGGCTGTFIDDQRNNFLQRYVWSGTVYVGKPLVPTTANLLMGDNAGHAVDSTIAPANVPKLNAATNTFTGTVNAAAGNVNGSPICTEATGCTGNGATYPPAGIGVSTGSAWSTSIDPADVPRLSGANNFTGSVSVAGKPVSTATLASTANLLMGDGNGNAVNSTIAPANVAKLTNGSLYVNGGIRAYGYANPDYSTANFNVGASTGNVVAEWTTTTDRKQITSHSSPSNMTFDFRDTAGILLGEPLYLAANGATLANAFTIYASDTPITPAANHGVIRVTANGDTTFQGTRETYINWDGSDGNFWIGNGSGTTLAHMDQSGNLAIRGTLTQNASPLQLRPGATPPAASTPPLASRNLVWMLVVWNVLLTLGGGYLAFVVRRMRQRMDESGRT